MEKPIDLTARKHFDIFDGALACLMFVALQYLLYEVIAKVGLGNQILYTLFSVLMQAMFFVSVLLTSKFRNVNWISAANFDKKINKKTILFSIGIAVVCLVLFTDITSAFMAMLEKFGYVSPLQNSSTSQYNDVSNLGEYFLSILTVCIIPPICEETLFRGAVLNSFRGTNKWIGIIFSGFCFMIMHGNPDQTVHQFILGIVLGYIAWETRNIWVCILIHAINNFVAITITYVYSLFSDGVLAGTTEAAMEYSWGDILGTLGFGLLYAALGGYFVWWLTKKIKTSLNKEKQTTPIVVSSAEDGEKVVETEVVVETPAEPVSETPTQTEEIQPKPTAKKIVLTVLSYAAFVGYFVFEWVVVLLRGLGH